MNSVNEEMVTILSVREVVINSRPNPYVMDADPSMYFTTNSKYVFARNKTNWRSWPVQNRFRMLQETFDKFIKITAIFKTKISDRIFRLSNAKF